MITSFVPLAASVLLTAQHLACAASCQEGPDFPFRQGVGEGTDVCIHGEGFAERIRPFPWLPLLLFVWPQYCWEQHSFLPAAAYCVYQMAGLSEQLSISILLCAVWPDKAS